MGSVRIVSKLLNASKKQEFLTFWFFAMHMICYLCSTSIIPCQLRDRLHFHVVSFQKVLALDEQLLDNAALHDL